jgi:hypothetical protein
MEVAGVASTALDGERNPWFNRTVWRVDCTQVLVVASNALFGANPLEAQRQVIICDG